MRWVMHSWERVSFFNRYLAGTLAPRLQMDLLPGLGCAAHFLILAPRPAETVDDYLAAGRAVQRFWLTATRLGLQLQPEQTPLIFAGYARAGRRFSEVAAAAEQARRLTAELDGLVGEATRAAPCSWAGSARANPPAPVRCACRSTGCGGSQARDGAPSPLMASTAGPRKRILFVAEAATLAHVARPLALAAALDPQRFEVRIACSAAYRKLVESQGIDYAPSTRSPPPRSCSVWPRASRSNRVAELERYVADDLG